MKREFTIHARGVHATHRLGELVGRALRGGEVVELCGPLGAGKTQFAKGLARGLGVEEREPVVSPTFVLVREYCGRVRFCHCDAYRLTSLEELLALGLEEMIADSAVVAIEWADRFSEVVAAPKVRVELSYVEGAEQERKISMESNLDLVSESLARELSRSDFEADWAGRNSRSADDVTSG